MFLVLVTGKWIYTVPFTPKCQYYGKSSKVLLLKRSHYSVHYTTNNGLTVTGFIKMFTVSNDTIL